MDRTKINLLIDWQRATDQAIDGLRYWQNYLNNWSDRVTQGELISNDEFMVAYDAVSQAGAEGFLETVLDIDKLRNLLTGEEVRQLWE